MLAIVTGLITGLIVIWVEKTNRIERVRENLKKWEGNYDVYHWTNLSTPDGCKYQIAITLDDKNSIFNIHQTGSESDHDLDAQVKIQESTFAYGNGHYAHITKRGSSPGEIQLFLIRDGVINVKKSYLRDENQQPENEQWQWRKI